MKNKVGVPSVMPPANPTLHVFRLIPDSPPAIPSGKSYPTKDTHKRTTCRYIILYSNLDIITTTTILSLYKQ